MVVVLVEKHDLEAFIAELLYRIDPAETAADDHDPQLAVVGDIE
jgi:hypothetical protein